MLANIVRIASVEDLVSESAGIQFLAPAHVFVTGSHRDVADALMRQSRDGLLSLMFNGGSAAAEHIAASIADVPVFLVGSDSEAQSIAAALEADPHSAVLRAINGVAVAIQYLEGSAT